MTDDDPGALGGAPPKLTIGQRLLTALPNLQRAPAPPAPARTSTSARAARSDPEAEAGSEAAGIDDESDAPLDAEDPDTTSTDVAASSGLGGRLRDSLLKPTPATARKRPGDDLEDMTNEEIAHRIKRLDDRERFLAITSAPIGVAVGTLLTVITLIQNPAVHSTGTLKHQAVSIILIEGAARILLSGVVLAAAFTRRRSFVGFSLLFLGTSMGSPLFALPFWGLGGYLIWRVFKYQKVLTARRGTSRATAGGRSAGGGRVPADVRAAGRAGATAARQRAQSPRRGRKEPTPTGPRPSKRYTPPRPTRPRPPAPSS